MSARSYRFTDPLDLPQIGAAEVLAGAEGVWIEDAAPRRQVRPPPEFHDDPDGAGLFRGFGDIAFTAPPPFVTSIRGGRLAGYRTTLTRDGRFMHDESLSAAEQPDYLDKLAGADPFSNEETGLRRLANGRFALTQTAREPSRGSGRISGSVVVLCAAEPYNFGSFIFRVLPKLHAIRRLGLGHLPVLVHARAAAQRQYLALLGVSEASFMPHDPSRLHTIAHAIRPAMRNPHAFLDAESRLLFAGLRQRFASHHGRRIYVSRLGHARRGGSSRVMVNEAALIDRLSGLGFAIVEPEMLSAQAQIEAFAGAEMVVGPAGAGMFNTVFCRPGTRVIDIESEPHWIHAHSCLFASAGHRYAIVEARVDPDDPRSVHRRWSVNIAALCDRIADFGTEPKPRPALPVPAAPAPRREGTLDRVTPDFAAGWARDPGCADPVEVEILVDGAPVGRILADRPRADLQAQGACAFRFVFPAAPRHDARIGARCAGTGHELAGSPRTVGAQE